MDEIKLNPNMHDMMRDKIAETLLANVDEIADVLRTDVGDGGTDRKLANLMAQMVMDRLTGRTLPDPGHYVSDHVKACEAAGQPLTVLEQDLLAQRAMSTIDYWGGNRSLPTADILWRMLLHGRFPEKYSAAAINAVLGIVHDSSRLYDDAVASAADTVREARKKMFDAVESACGRRDAGILHDHLRNGGVSEQQRSDIEQSVRAAVGACCAACDDYDDALETAFCRMLEDAGLGGDFDSDFKYVALNMRHGHVNTAISDADAIRKALEPYLK